MVLNYVYCQGAFLQSGLLYLVMHCVVDCCRYSCMLAVSPWRLKGNVDCYVCICVCVCVCVCMCGVSKCK